jgi:hypothetical protein
MANKNKGELRNQANSAKQRLKQGFYQEVIKQRDKEISRAESYGKDISVVKENFRKKTLQSLGEKENPDIERLYTRVCEILENDDDSTNPIGKLIDTKIYESLDSSAKQRYVLELSQKFRELSERYANEKNKNKKI